MNTENNQQTSPRPLEGVVIGISVSCGEDTGTFGVGEDEMNHLIVRLSDRLLTAGARLAFGHDWRPDGVMAAVARLAARYEPAGQISAESCRITNFVPWGNRPELPADLRQELEARGILRIEEVGILPALAAQEKTRGRVWLEAVALSLMRQRLANFCDARVCLGGKFEKFQGFCPGIVEEAWTSAAKGTPVYVSRLLGGASARLIQAARDGSWEGLINADAFRQISEIADIAGDGLPSVERLEAVLASDALQQLSGLNEALWQRLTDARDIDVVGALVIAGLTARRSG